MKPLKLHLVLEHGGRGITFDTFVRDDGKREWVVQLKTKNPVIGWAICFPKQAWWAMKEHYYNGQNMNARASESPSTPKPKGGATN